MAIAKIPGQNIPDVYLPLYNNNTSITIFNNTNITSINTTINFRNNAFKEKNWGKKIIHCLLFLVMFVNV